MRDETAVILVAGEGTRLRPYTLTRPKCLLEVGGKTLLDWSVDAIAACGVRRIVLVVGYLEEQVRQHAARFGGGAVEVRFALNARYATTNNIVSAQIAREHVGAGGLLLLDGDLVFETRALARLLDAPGEAVLMLHRVPLGDEEMKIRADTDGRVKAVGKHLPIAGALGESVGVARMAPSATDAFWSAISALVDAGRTDAWYEDAFQRCIDDGVEYRVADVTGLRCMEIDTAADLAAAQALAVEILAAAR
ncbi:MAG: phosphocholine cytidylyltransferase family protein [Myxococcota bacterium]